MHIETITCFIWMKLNILLVSCIENFEEIDGSVNYSNFGESNREDL